MLARADCVRPGLFALLFCLAGLWLFAGCTREASSTTTQEDASTLSGRLSLSGSSTVAPLMLEIAKRFESLHPSVRIDVQTGGSTRGILDVREGTVDIGMISRAATSDEADLVAYRIGLDGLCMIVHASNTAPSLSREEIASIYTGRIDNWKAMNGEERAITVVSKAEGRSTLELFLGYFQLQNSQLKPDIIVGDNVQGIKSVAGDPGAIAYVSIGSALAERVRGESIRLLSLAGVDATIEHVRDGSFPLLRDLTLLVRSQPRKDSLLFAFLEFAQSDDVHDLIEGLSFVPITR
ncbi:MAG: phosphate ABC transporter substrate-binding protein [Phycisphaerales bacterium]